MLFLSISRSMVASWAVLGLLSPAIATVVEVTADDVEVAVFTNTITVTILSTSTSYPSSCPLGTSSLPFSNILQNSSIAIPANEVLSTNLTLMPHVPTASILLPSLFQSNLTNTMATVTALNVSTSPTMVTVGSSYVLDTTSPIAPQSVQQNSTTLVSTLSTTADVVPTTSSEQPSTSPISTTSVPISTNTPLLDTSTSSSTSTETTTAVTTDISSTSSSMSSPPLADTTTSPGAYLDLSTTTTSSVEATTSTESSSTLDNVTTASTTTLETDTITTSSVEVSTTSTAFSSSLDDATTAPSTTSLDALTTTTDSVEVTPTNTESSSTSDDTTTASTTLDMTTSTTSSVETASSSAMTDITTMSVTSIDTTASSTTSTVLTPTPTDTNIVVNGGFETSATSYSPWTLGLNYPYITYSINDTVAAHGGSNALQIQYTLVSATIQTYITQILSTTTGSTYDFSMWVMSGTSLSAGYCIVWAHDAADHIIASWEFTALTSLSWTELTGTYTATSDSTVLYLRTECPNIAIRARTIFVDDVSMILAS